MGNIYVKVAMASWAVLFATLFLVFTFTLSFEATFGHNGEVKFVLSFWEQIIVTTILSSIPSSILVLSGFCFTKILRNKANRRAKTV